MMNRNAIIEGTIVLTMFLIVLWIQIIPLSKFIFGSIHDTSLHALLVELILENKQVPATHEPFLPTATIYPQAPHVICAYSSYILGYIPATAVFYISSLFNAMSVLGAYYLGKKIRPTGYLGANLAFVIAFVSIWPKYITWGSNPFIIGVPLFLIGLGFLPSLSRLKTRNNTKEAIVIGVLLGYLAAMHLSFYQVVIVSIALWLLVEAFHKSISKIKLRNFLLILVFSILLIAPFVYRYIAFYAYPTNNRGSPYDPVTDPTTPPTPNPDKLRPPINLILGDFTNWLFSSYNIHPVFLLRCLWVGLFVISAVTLLIYLWRKRELYILEKIALTTFGACILLILSAYFLPTDILHWGRTGMIWYITVCLFITAFNIRLYSILKTFHTNVFKLPRKPRAIIMKRFTVILLIFSALYAPFVYDTLSKGPQRLISSYGIFAITEKDDYELMIWMKRGINQNATILINPYEPGMFIPSISHHKVVFPFSKYQLSVSYRRLVSSIWQGVLNETTYILMKNFNVTHVFVSSKVTYWWEGYTRWDPQLFLNHPNFKLIKNIGRSYVFVVSY